MNRTAAARLRALLMQPGVIVAPAAYDGLIARVFQAEGCEALFVSGNATSTSVGLVDLGLTTMTEVVERARQICDSVEIPVLVDADTGYGNALNVQRTVRELERAGAAGLMLEDQTFPKRCGLLEGKGVIPLVEAANKIRAAVDGRQNPDTVILARTDARTVEGLDAAIERALAYAAAGADMVFVETPASQDEMRRIARAVPVPLMSTETVAMKRVTTRELEDLGYKLLAIAGAVTAAVFRAARDLARYLRQHGTLAGYEANLVPRSEIDQVIGLKRLLDQSDRYR